ncbi:MAG: hypothetical protein J7499_00830 [Sphingopyxis sp.]|nr:hypothetical protein [Sphingopyxis sp.]
MQIEAALPRLALATSAILILSGLLWWNARDESQAGGRGVVTVQALSSPAAGAPVEAFALVEQQILDTLGEPGTRLHNLRIVDQERLIVCGERVVRGSATPRRFVWLSQLGEVVTDDGGPDFAILQHVCNPPPPSRIYPLSPGESGSAGSRGPD